MPPPVGDEGIYTQAQHTPLTRYMAARQFPTIAARAPLMISMAMNSVS